MCVLFGVWCVVCGVLGYVSAGQGGGEPFEQARVWVLYPAAASYQYGRFLHTRIRRSDFEVCPLTCEARKEGGTGQPRVFPGHNVNLAPDSDGSDPSLKRLVPVFITHL